MEFESDTLGTTQCTSTSGLSLGPCIDKKTLKKKSFNTCNYVS